MIPIAPGFFRPSTGSVESDPCFDEVILLLHGEGADSSTTITDSSASNKTATVYGSAQIKTAQYKYGDSSIYFDGVGDYIDYADSNDWDFGYIDYTWEFWARPDDTTAAALRRVFGQGNSTGGNSPISCALTTNGKWVVYVWNGADASPNYTTIGGDSFSSAQCEAGRWDHVAIVCKYIATPIPTNNFKLFVNGVLVDDGSPISENAQQVDTKMAIGRLGEYNGQYYKGYLDEVRFTQGCARYTEDFIPPTAAFPDQ